MPISQYFRLVDVQARMLLKGEASNLLLGYIWWILEPMLYVAVFYLVFDVILDSKRADFMIFLMCGKIPFMWFSKSLNQAANGIVANSGLIGRINVPKSLFPMAIVQQGAYKQVPVFAFLVAVMLLSGYPPTVQWLWLVPLVMLQYLMIVACSLIGSILVCFLRDFTMVINLATIFLMFTSGIFWDVRDLGDPRMTEMVLTFNPLAFVLDGYRQVLMFQTPPDLSLLVQFAVLFVAISAMVLGYMRRADQLLALKALT